MPRLPAVRQGERKEAMVKVKCRVCGDIGYTAAPRRVVCKCGGMIL
ncbi:MAG: hypothetical protein NT066_06780 [Candidatus Omnitrophica bacterium]|nr:hypothetical protein [Candidatus Omnitrophota bacterium]